MALQDNPLLLSVSRSVKELAGRALRSLPRDQLVRFANRPAAEHLPLLRTLGSRLWCQYRERQPLRQPLDGQLVCLFAHFDPDGIIDDYVIHHLSCLRQAGALILFVTTAPPLSAYELGKLKPHCAAIVERENLGFDFGSWRTALLLYPRILRSKTLLFANSSVYGPFCDLRPIIDKMAATGCDFWGITESLEIEPHYQSYFLGFHGRCLRSPAFLDYFQNIAILADKDEVIQQYEVTLKQRLSAHRLRGAALVPASPDQRRTENPTLHRWRQVLAAGSPYLKVQLLRENPHRQLIDDWPEVVREHGYDPALIESHLRRTTLTSPLAAS